MSGGSLPGSPSKLPKAPRAIQYNMVSPLHPGSAPEQVITHLKLELSRESAADDPHTFQLTTQRYYRYANGAIIDSAEIPWDDSLLHLLRAWHQPSQREPRLAELAHIVQTFLKDIGWAGSEVELRQALAVDHTVYITLQLHAAELFLLPWELVRLPPDVRYLSQRPDVLLRYTWPGVRANPATRSVTERVLLAWSAGGGKLPVKSHERALRHASGRDRQPDRQSDIQPVGQSSSPTPEPGFDDGGAILGSVTRQSLRARLEKAAVAGAPVTVLHLLCHGVEDDGGFGLSWTDERGDEDIVHAHELLTVLGKSIRHLRLIILSACESARMGDQGTRTGSIAQAIHRAGVPWVIGSRLPLSKEGSARFAELFYQHLCTREVDVEEAFLCARSGLAAESAKLDWASLQLYAAAQPGRSDDPQRGPSMRVAPESPKTPPEQVQLAGQSGLLPASAYAFCKRHWQAARIRWLVGLTVLFAFVLGLYKLGVETHRARLLLIGLTDIDLSISFVETVLTGAEVCIRLLRDMIAGLIVGSGIERWAAPLIVAIALAPFVVSRRRRRRAAIVAGILALAIIAYSTILYATAVGIHHVAMAEGLHDWQCGLSSEPGAAPASLAGQIRHEVCSWVVNDDSGGDINDGRRAALAGLLGWHFIAALLICWTFWRCARAPLTRAWSWTVRAAMLAAVGTSLLLVPQAPRAYAIAHYGLRYPRVIAVEESCHAELHQLLIRIERGEIASDDDVPLECTVVVIARDDQGALLITHGADCPGQSLDEDAKPRLLRVRSRAGDPVKCISATRGRALITE